MNRVKKDNYSWLMECLVETLLKIDDEIDYENSIVRVLNGKLKSLESQKAYYVYQWQDDEALELTNEIAKVKAQLNARQGKIESMQFVKDYICSVFDNKVKDNE